MEVDGVFAGDDVVDGATLGGRGLAGGLLIFGHFETELMFSIVWFFFVVIRACAVPVVLCCLERVY